MGRGGERQLSEMKQEVASLQGKLAEYESKTSTLAEGTNESGADGKSSLSHSPSTEGPIGNNDSIFALMAAGLY